MHHKLLSLWSLSTFTSSAFMALFHERSTRPAGKPLTSQDKLDAKIKPDQHGLMNEPSSEPNCFWTFLTEE